MDEIIYENVIKNELKLASFKRRATASVIDFILMIIVLSVLMWSHLDIHQMEALHGFLLSMQDGSLGTADASALQAFRTLQSLSLYFIGIYFFYVFVFAFFYGGSIGKFICKITIIDNTTLSRPSFMSAILRAFSKTFFDVIIIPTFVIAGGFVYGIYFYGKSKRSLNDMLSKTIVVENTL